MQKRQTRFAKSLCILRVGLAICGVAMALPASAQPGQERLVTRPGVVLIDPPPWPLPRQARGSPALSRLCGQDADHPLPLPLGRLIARDGYGTDPRAKALSFAVMTRAAAWAGLADADAAARAAAEAVDVLYRWARADALSRLDSTTDGRNTKSVYALKVVLMGLIPNWALLTAAAAADPPRKHTIDRWLGRRVAAANVPTGGRESRFKPRRCAENEGLPRSPLSNCNNHRYLRDAVAMAWGAYVGDDGLFRQGLERFRIALQQMRPDGSLPLETMRGARALWYQRHALASLTVMAAIAARQGHDLYGLELEGRSLAAGIRFLSAAIGQEDRVRAYAAANAIPGPSPDWRRQDLGFLAVRARRHYMAWTGLFQQHPGLSPQADRMFMVAEETGALIDDYSGGNISCLSRLPRRSE